jgi:hypothetical protein
MVDLFAVGFPAVLAAHLLPPVRALQSRGLAVACPRDRARPRSARFVASWRSLAGSHHRRDPATCWLFVAWAYLLARYDTINWAASYFAAGYAVEALLLVWTGLIRNRLSLRPGRDAAGAAGLCIFVLALFAWPLVGRLFGRPWLQAEIFGIAPDPTVVATLGVLIAADRTHWELLLVPLLWCAISGATMWAMQSPDALLMPAAALLALVVACWKTLSRLRRASPA